MSARLFPPALVACALVAVACTAARADAVRMPDVQRVATSPNRTDARRTYRSIRQVVVHVTEGGFAGSLRWMRNPRSRVSSHYLVARDGGIAQLVSLGDVAWHAGNRAVNFRSIGIEHVGWTYGPDGFTGAQYRASARLTAALLKRFRIPADRRHVIGHDEVRDPGSPWLLGGASNHTDPGPNWHWSRYMALVRRYVRGAAPLRVESHGVRPGAVLRGFVRWRAAATAPARRVDFLVDGRVLWSDRRRPFTFGRAGLPSMHLANGRHVLSVRAVAGSRRVTERVGVTVRNRVFDVTTAGARRWGRVRGTVPLRARVWGARARSVTLFVDGRRAAVDRRAPFAFRWDSRLRRDGKHVLLVVARARDGRVTRQRIPVVAANRARPARPAAPVISEQSLLAGSTVTEFTVWRVDTARPVTFVEFLVDGLVVGRDVAPPFTFGVVPTDAPGTHRLTARAVGPGGRTESAVDVTYAG